MKKTNVPVFILAGGLGTRLSEETGTRPKPMVEIGEFPIVIHIMRWYYSHGFNDFVLCSGYKSWEIKKYFLEYQNRANHLEIDHRDSTNGSPKALGQNNEQEKWRVRVIDTGEKTMTGARIARAFDFVSQQQVITDFAVTYGDGVSDVDLSAEWKFHESHKKVGTVLGVHPRARFGELDVKNETVVASFLEKPQSRQGFINGGFMFFKESFRPYLDVKEHCVLERGPLEKLAAADELRMFKHDGYWHPMDTLMDKRALEAMWTEGRAPWVPKRAKESTK